MAALSKLKNMNLWLDGYGHSGVVSEVVLPKLTIKMAEWRGGGMLGPLQIDQGLEKLELETTVGGLVDLALRQFGATAFDAVHARFVGKYQDDGSGTVRTVEINVLGRYTTIDMGTAKIGDDTQHKSTLAVVYYELIVDGEQWLEIDVMNNIFVVFGVDRYAEIRDGLED